MEIINLSTAGIHLGYAIEETAGTRPTSGYTDLPGVKSTPSLNPSPDTLDATTLNDSEWKVYIQGLKDLGGNLEFTFNLTQALLDTWDSLMTAYEAGITTGKNCWFMINIPRTNRSILL
jgi:hypothetical protein